MKKTLIKIEFKLTGDTSSLTGVSQFIFGNVTGLRGDATGLCGDVSDCELTPEDRNQGVNIQDLVQ
jgi:hypothetical protein